MGSISQLFNQAVNLQQTGQLGQAEFIYRQILQVQPSHSEAHQRLGILLHQTRRPQEAVAFFEKAIVLNPREAVYHVNLGSAYFNQGRFEEALATFRQALVLSPDFAEAHNNLANVHLAQEKFPEALAGYEHTLRLHPQHAEAHNNRGIALFNLGRSEEAANAFLQAIQLKPNYAEAFNNLGRTLREQGRLEEAIACFQHARKSEPANPVWHSNLLFSMMYHPGYSSKALLDESRRWEVAYARPLMRANQAFSSDPSPERRLRVGYLSPDFREHVVGRNIWPLISHHNHAQFEITLYSCSPKLDAMTERFRQGTDHWRAVAGWTDEKTAGQIRQDGIDLLVDLALHTGGNQLLVFARKPAPVQITFGGYPGTTGLSSIDYRLTDPFLDPAGLHDDCYAEKSYRLPHSFWCYDPQSEEPAVGPLPAQVNGFVTFGCMNTFWKINEEVIKLWARVLAAVPRSRLLLLAKEGSHRDRVRALFAQHGIAAERVEFCAPRPRAEYLALYQRVDIGLDTLPYNGHTTSLDSFWMGVPVITLVGTMVVGRAGLSQLSNLGLPELAATTPQSFMERAVDLASDLPGLASLRAGLRERVKKSPLMDAAGFARDIETAYRAMWRQWCAQASLGSANRG
jgi:protein O-GlcNAc transferase